MGLVASIVLKVSDGSNHAFCTWCHKPLAPKISTLQNHIKSKEHLSRAKNSSSLTAGQSAKAFFNVQKISNKVKEVELEMALLMHVTVPSKL